jgi:putative spermidine/putrescine transport system ATP-binding protein
VALTAADGTEMSAILPDSAFYADPFEPGAAVEARWAPEDEHRLAA